MNLISLTDAWGSSNWSQECSEGYPLRLTLANIQAAYSPSVLGRLRGQGIPTWTAGHVPGPLKVLSCLCAYNNYQPDLGRSTQLLLHCSPTWVSLFLQHTPTLSGIVCHMGRRIPSAVSGTLAGC